MGTNKRRALLATVTALAFVGCTSEYSVRIDGDVKGAETATPRSVKSGVYQGTVDSMALSDAARGSLSPIKDAKVSIALRFDEKVSASSVAVPVDSRTAHFHFEATGKTSEHLTGYHIRVEAPGYATLEKLVPIEGEKNVYDGNVLAVLDPTTLPPPGAKPRETPAEPRPGEKGPEKENP